jgi:hypothetical protein
VDVRVEQGSGGLGRQPVKDGGDTCQAAGDAYGVRYSREGLVVWASKPSEASLRSLVVWALKPSGFGGLGLKTRVKVSRRNGRHVAASRSSRQGEAIS